MFDWLKIRAFRTKKKKRKKRCPLLTLGRLAILDRGQICRRYGQKHNWRGVNTIIVQMFDGKGVVAWTHGNSGERLLKQGGGGGST